jgi:signal transduction histidine kinase
MSASPRFPEERPLADKVRSSLVLKLNLRMAWSLMAGFLALDLLLGLMLLGMALWRVEDGARRILEDSSFAMVAGKKEQAAEVLGYSFRTKALENDTGLVLPDFLQRRLPLGMRESRRWISAPKLLAPATLNERLNKTFYCTSLLYEDKAILITYPLGPEIMSLLRLLAILLAAQLLYVISSLGKNTRALRKTLKPLAEMASAARDLQQSVASFNSVNSGAGVSGLQNLTGALSHIDARQLDQRIAVDEAQHELKSLAQAINDMLSRIQESYQSQIRFVSDASHELRTPISVIQGYARLLNRWGKEDAKVAQEAIDAIQAEAESMQSLVEQLLFLARGDSDTMPLYPETFDLCLLGEEILRDARLIDSEHKFCASLNSPAMITADRQLLKQALRILVDNSIKYTPPGEKISLKVDTAAGQVKIQVQDNGIGIPPADVPHIFDRFYRSDESRTRQTGGVGLGLAIAQWIIQRHQGQLEVLSRPDIGTRTTITLPAGR